MHTYRHTHTPAKGDIRVSRTVDLECARIHVHSQMCYSSVVWGNCLWLLFLLSDLFHWSATEFQSVVADKILPFLSNYMNCKYCFSLSMGIFAMLKDSSHKSVERGRLQCHTKFCIAIKIHVCIIMCRIFFCSHFHKTGFLDLLQPPENTVFYFHIKIIP